MKDYYYILGVRRDATIDDIKIAYRKLTKKFHPDANDGDLFFAERFKDIQEAYECLSHPSRRKDFDSTFFRTSSNPSKASSNFSPEIVLFTSNKPEIHLGEEIKFSWTTINADVVSLDPLGSVDPIGEATYRIKNALVSEMRFKLVAENSNIQRRCEKELVVKNLTYEKIYEQAYNDIAAQNRRGGNDPSDLNADKVPKTMPQVADEVDAFVNSKVPLLLIGLLIVILLWIIYY